MIRRDKNNSEILVVDTLKDLLQLLANHEIWVRFSDTSELRHIDIEEDFGGDEEWVYQRPEHIKAWSDSFVRSMDLKTTRQYIK